MAEPPVLVVLAAGVTGWLVEDPPSVIGILRNERVFRPVDDVPRPVRDAVAEALSDLDEAWLGSTARAVCGEVLDALETRPRFDLTTDYALPVAGLVLTRVLRIGPAAGRRVVEGLRADGRAADVARVVDGVVHLATGRPAARSHDLAAGIGGRLAPDHDATVAAVVRLLVHAAEPTAVWTALTLRRVVTDGDVAARLAGGRLYADEVLDAVLWSDPPLLALPRRLVTEDTEVGGQALRRGEVVVVGLNAAQTRLRAEGSAELGNRSYLAFGSGTTACPARRATRIIVQAAVTEALRRPALRLPSARAEPPVPPAPPGTRSPAAGTWAERVGPLVVEMADDLAAGW
ncbi:hypothetical protein GCM10028784_19960 [Myceligenerans cantabricum]